MSADVPQLHLDRQLCFALHSASRAVVRAYAPLLDQLGLTYPQYLAMLVLWEAPDAAVSVGELGARLRLDSGTLTPLLQRLERAGLVRRDRDATDERRVLISLTTTGAAMRDQARDVPAKLGGKLGLDLPAALAMKTELEALVAALDSHDAT